MTTPADFDDDDDLSIEELEAEIRDKQKELDDLEGRLAVLRDKKADEDAGLLSSGIPKEAMERVKEVGLRDFWTAPHTGKKA